MIKRRTFIIAGLGSAAAWPVVARAQQALPVVGVLIGGTAQPDGTGFVEGNMAALRKGLSDTGFVEGNNVEILHLGAESQYDRLPALAAELVRRRVAVIFALWNVPALAAKSATETLPVVFAMGGDPIQLGLVARLNRPDANVTGVYALSAASIQKRLVSRSSGIRDRLRSFGLRCRRMEGLRHSVYISADGYNLLAARPIESAQQRTHAQQQNTRATHSFVRPGVLSTIALCQNFPIRFGK
jgi:hypothetical protein